MENQENQEKIIETVEKLDFQKRVDDFIKELDVLKAKYKVDFKISIDFPDYKVLPDDLQLGLRVVGKHRMNYIVGFSDTEVKDANNKR